MSKCAICYGQEASDASFEALYKGAPVKARAFALATRRDHPEFDNQLTVRVPMQSPEVTEDTQQSLLRTALRHRLYTHKRQGTTVRLIDCVVYTDVTTEPESFMAYGHFEVMHL